MDMGELAQMAKAEESLRLKDGTICIKPSLLPVCLYSLVTMGSVPSSAHNKQV